MRIKTVSLTTASRRNPELNPKVTAYEYLRKWKDDPDVYISFTEINKLGINPQSKFNTPLGIYTYPLREAWTHYDIDNRKELSSLPFGSNRDHIWVVTPTDKHSFIQDLYTDYGSDKFDRDISKLHDMYCEYYDVYRAKQVQEFGNSDPETIARWKKSFNSGVATKWRKIYNEALETAREKNSVSSFWNMSRLLADALSTNGVGIKSATKWNTILRTLGYSGFADKSSKGIIHPAEPLQAVFLSRSAFKVLGQCDNVNHATTDNRLKIRTMRDFNKALEKCYSPHVSMDMFLWLLGRKAFPILSSTKTSVSAPDVWASGDWNEFTDLIHFIEHFKTQDWKELRLDLEQMEKMYDY